MAINSKNPKLTPIPVVPRTMRIVNGDGTVTRSGQLLLEQLQSTGGTVTNTGGALTSDLPVFGAGGNDIKTGTKSGNTDELATISGSLTNGHIIIADASGNLVDGGPPSGGGVGAVSSVFGRTGAVVATSGDYTAAQVTNAVSSIGSYADPAWITSLSYSKLTGVPSVGSYQTPWLQNINAANYLLTNAGNIGIGNDASVTPDATSYPKLMVGSTTSTALLGDLCMSNYYVSGTTSGTTGRILWSNYAIAGSDKRVAIIAADLDGAYNSALLRINLTAAGTMTERLRITSAGNVGIGNPGAASPDGAAGRLMLVVGSQSVATSTGIINSNYSTTATSGEAGMFAFANFGIAAAEKRLGVIDCVYAGAYNSGSILFWTLNAGAIGERMRILNNGNVGIGVSGPTHLLELSADSAAKPSSNIWTIFSDARLKRNIQPFTHGLETLLRFRPVSYEYNGEAGMPEGAPGVGLIAQEAEQVYPACVRKTRKEIAGEQTDVLCTNTSDLAYMMLNAFREIDGRLKRLEKNEN